MIDELFEFYCNLLKTKILFDFPESKNKSRLRYLRVLFIVISICFIVSIFCLVENKFLLYILISIVLVIFMIIFNKIYSKKFSNYFCKRRKIIKDKIIEELKTKGIAFNNIEDTSVKISKLSEVYSERSKLLGFELPVVPPYMVALFIALFSGFISYIFSNAYFKSLSNGIRVSIAIFLVILMLFITYYLILLPVLKILNSKKQKMMDLSKLLKDISLELSLFGCRENIKDKILSK